MSGDKFDHTAPEYRTRLRFPVGSAEYLKARSADSEAVRNHPAMRRDQARAFVDSGGTVEEAARRFRVEPEDLLIDDEKKGTR